MLQGWLRHGRERCEPAVRSVGADLNGRTSYKCRIGRQIWRVQGSGLDRCDGGQSLGWAQRKVCRLEGCAQGEMRAGYGEGPKEDGRVDHLRYWS